MKIKYLIYFGFLLLAASFIYDILFINIPFQDPTPEIIIRKNRQYFMKDIIFWGGLVLTGLGMGWMMVMRIKNCHKMTKS